MQSEQIKLPKEVQEIIYYYANGQHKPFKEGKNVDLDNALACIVDMVTELAPYLEDAFVPDFLNRPYSSGDSHTQERIDLAEFVRSKRTELPKQSDQGQAN